MRQGADCKDDDGMFAFAPSSIDAVLLTPHTRSQRPAAAAATAGVCGQDLCDQSDDGCAASCCPTAGTSRKMEAEWRTRKAVRAGRPPVEPLYTAQQAIDCMEAFVPRGLWRDVRGRSRADGAHDGSRASAGQCDDRGVADRERMQRNWSFRAISAMRTGPSCAILRPSPRRIWW